MFKEGNKITTEAIPERVFCLYRIVNKDKEINKKDLKNKMIPDDIDEGKDSNYFKYSLVVADELELVREEGNTIIINSQINSMRDISDLRKYVNSILIQQYSDGPFSRVTKDIFDANHKVLEYNSVSEMTNLVKNVETQGNTMNGWRFWASFLGFGVLGLSKNKKDNTSFIPNCYQFIVDILPLTELKKGTLYTIDEFVSAISPYAQLVLGQSLDKRFNFGMSNALRTMHNNEIVKLEFFNDQDSEWMLDRLDIHSIVDKVTHITIL
ncbi:hypothetical protein [uncultured Catenibacterium sp.]|uniref:hypothetical protein n=1 Tax=uncultured Catenibacterium sp. TaxID=286142 RepID=UPI0025F8D3F0|nr:hypothetical protein [uncultured Catenibacterium sp.]